MNVHTRWIALAAVASVSLLTAALPKPHATGARAADPMVILIVVDGLRPDAITPADMPNLDRLRREGVEYVNSHSTMPTVTRVNGAVFSTGRWPRNTGILSNSPFIASFDSLRPVSTSDAPQMRALAAATGRLVAPTTLAERLKAAGKRFVSVNSGSGGNGLFSNPQAAAGDGILINPNLGEGAASPRRAYPDSVARVIAATFGNPPADSAASTLNGLQSWSDRIIRQYVLPTLHPDVIATWTAEPDESQHRYGVGSPEAREGIRNVDRDIGLLIATLDSLGLRDRANIIVTSDHGFALHDVRVDVEDSLIAGGFKRARESTDIVVTGDAQSVQLFVAQRDPAVAQRVVAWLRQRAWVDAIFTSRGDSTQGTFALSDLHLDHPTRAPDILFTLPWSDTPNRFGAPGSQMISGRGRAGPMNGTASGHGGASPWTVHNTLIMWGPAFKQKTTVEAPAGTVDVLPTILAVMGLPAGDALDGRALTEALRSGPAPSSVRWTRVVHTARAPGFEARMQFSEIAGGPRYMDRAWRVR